VIESIFFLLGSVLGGLAVVLGAFGSHTLKTRLTSEQLANFETGVRYQMYHSLALFLVAFGLWLNNISPRLSTPALLLAAGLFFGVGILLFSGSLYLLTATGKRWLGIITPFGGFALIAGWLCLALSVL
jgi:uncharacterized membrane protein YgdD (TMEM256/DUF423 family)